MKRLLILSFIAMCLPLVAIGQTGFPPYGSFQEGRFDTVNRQNLNVNFAIPIVSVPARGMNFQFAIVHDSLVWRRVNNVWTPVSDASGNPTWGWKKEFVTGEILKFQTTEWCGEGPNREDMYPVTVFSNWKFTDTAGTIHEFDLEFNEAYDPTCNTPGDPRTGYALDGSGYYLDATNPYAPIVMSPGGLKVDNTSKLTDTNGNFLSKTVTGNQTDWKDTTGRIALKVQKLTGWSNCGTDTSITECIRYKYTDANGTEQTIQLDSKTYNVRSSFGCSFIVEYNQNGKILPYRVKLPNNREYTFDYEASPADSAKITGRLRKVTLPTGGSYEYEYPNPNNGIECSDGTTKKMFRRIKESETANAVEWEFT